MTNKEELIESLTSVEIADALIEQPQPSANNLEESSEELKAMGFREITDVDQAKIMNEALKNVQIQRTLNDLQRGSHDKKSARDYLEHHIDFLCRISPGKTKVDIAKSLTYEHAVAILKTTAKMEIPEALLKKHLKTIKKKYS
jgi:hypothetical protein